jgi:cell division transport system permease protein
MRANFVMSGVATGLRRNLLMTITLIAITAVSLFFLGGSLLTSKEISKFRTDYEGKLNVSIFLCSSFKDSQCTHTITPAEQKALEAKLHSDPQIASVGYISSAQAVQRAKDTFASAFPELVEPGSLPASLVLKLHDVKRDFKEVQTRYQSMPGVDQIANQDDSIKTILKIFDGARVSALIFAVIVLFCAIVLMSITIQVAASQRRNETSIMRLVGASRWMTELPFIIEAVIASLVGGVVAMAALFVGKHYVLQGIFRDQVNSRVLPDLSSNDVLIAGGVAVGVGVALAALTAFTTLRAYVRL